MPVHYNAYEKQYAYNNTRIKTQLNLWVVVLCLEYSLFLTVFGLPGCKWTFSASASELTSMSIRTLNSLKASIITIDFCLSDPA